MAGLTKYEKTALVLTAGFVLATGLWFQSQQRFRGSYQVVVSQVREERDSAQELEQPEGQAQWPDSLLPGERIDLNTADVYELQRLPGIGEKRAQDIIDYRQSHGPFETVDELDQVPGIGQGILDGLREYAWVGEYQIEE